MKLWNKNENIDTTVEKFTVGKDRELDLRLARFDVLGSIAHIKMLEQVGLLEQEDLRTLLGELRDIYGRIAEGNFRIEDGVEDIHSQIEFELTRKLEAAGEKIHTGRSRNDQVLLDLRLFMRDEIRNLTEHIQRLFDCLMELSERYKDDLLPGYTHLQVAMPSSFGLWFAAYAESLADDLQLVLAAYRLVNKNPLGSAAGYGSSLPLNRRLTTGLLGFDSMNYNVVYAQMGRGKTEKTVSMAIAAVAATLGKLAGDVCLYMNQNFGFLALPETFTTGSSIMPHKKNPDVFELIRARCNKLQALPNEVSLITANLPSGYHRDFQVLKESVLPAFDDMEACLKMATLALENVVVKENILEHSIYKNLFSVEAVNQLVLQGVPFRSAYREIAREIREDRFSPPAGLNYTHEGSLGNLMNGEIRAEMENTLADFHFEKAQTALEALLQ